MGIADRDLFHDESDRGTRQAVQRIADVGWRYGMGTATSRAGTSAEMRGRHAVSTPPGRRSGAVRENPASPAETSNIINGARARWVSLSARGDVVSAQAPAPASRRPPEQRQPEADSPPSCGLWTCCVRRYRVHYGGTPWRAIARALTAVPAHESRSAHHSVVVGVIEQHGLRSRISRVEGQRAALMGRRAVSSRPPPQEFLE